MRKLMWFTIGFAGACGLCVYVLPFPWIRLALISAGIAGCVLALLDKLFPVLRRIGLVFLGCALGFFWYSGFQTRYLAAPAALDGKTETVTIRTADYGTETEYGFSVEGRLPLEGRSYRVRMYLKETEPLEPGCLITGPFRFAVTAPEEDPVSYLSGDGIFLIARQEKKVTIAADPEETFLDQIARLRQWIRDALHSCFPADAEPFARALLLGDTGLLDYETDTDFKISGIRHVIAVSGLHVSILTALLAAVTFRKRYWMPPVGLIMLFLFAALAGFTPSVSRACIMSGLMLLALLTDREYDGATALSFAVLVMLVCNPLAVTSVSLQLSAASVAGIYLFNPRILPWLQSLLPDAGESKWKRKIKYWFTSSISITLSAMTLTTPLCACYFGMVSLVGIVTNLLVLWIVSSIFYGIMAVCLLYGVWPSAAQIFGTIIAWPIRYVLATAGVLADVPLAAVYTDSVYIVLWLGFVYLLLAVFLFSKKRSPVQLLCSGVLALCIALLASWTEPGDTRVTILDVGQGQCILLQNGKQNYLVDCGGDSDAKTADIAAGYLLSHGISRLDGMILTHMDRDHAGGAAYLLSRVDTELLILPPVYSELSAGETVYVTQDLHLQAGEATMTVYAANFPGTANEKSLCVLFDTEKCDILITGDRDGFGERMLLRNAELPPVDILVAGHHGSKHSTCEELLQAVSPEIVCISVGVNAYGHPAPELLQRIAAAGCTVYRTDKHGTIQIRR